MSNNGTDRDVALQLLNLLTTCAGLVASINDKLYVPHITTQPTDFEGEIGDTATFAVVADHVKSYQWQFSANAGTTWGSAGDGSTSATFSIGITAPRLNQIYRCQITGLDNSVIYTDTVKMVAPGS